MTRARMRALSFLAAWLATLPCHGTGLESAGNTDGVLTWRPGLLEKGQSAREVVIFAFDGSAEGVARRVEEARRLFAVSASPPAAEGGPAPAKVWIQNDSTDFALEGPCFFRWRIERQSLAGPRGGQLSQFTWYVHYEDGEGRHRAGTPQDGDSTPENLRIVEPVRPLGAASAAGVVETADGKLRIRVQAGVGPGPIVGVEIVLTSLHGEPLRDVRLTAYANIESAHDHENDWSFLDSRTGGLLVFDPPTGTCAVMAGLERPATGWSGTWNSFPWLQAGDGVPLERWKPFTGATPEMLERIARERRRAQAPPDICLPVIAEPVEPETRTLSGAEARLALERDWLFQAEGKALGARALEETGWARVLAARLGRDPKSPDLRLELSELAALEQRLHALSGGAGGAAAERDLYLAVREAKRRIVFKNPAVDFTRLLFIDQPSPQGYAVDHEAIHRMGIMAVPGGRLLELDGLHPGGRVRKLAPEKPGSFWRPDISFDGQRVLFCYKAHDEKSFHVYEVQADGTGLRRITSGDYDDADPMYLPDGHILFLTTRGNTYVRCGPFIYSYILARCDPDGGNLYLVSCGNEPEWTPALLEDGRVIYSRWEYTDKPLWRVQSLWTTNQDGTGTAVFWGNQSVWPDHLSEPRPIPGSRRVMFSGVGHHDWFSGSIGIIDPALGSNFPDGLTKVTCDLPWPECGTPPVDPCEAADYHASGRFTGYKTPYPLSEEDFLVSARTGEGKFNLYLMDVHGNRELVYEGAFNIWHAIPLKPRPVPPEQPDRVAWPGTGKDRKEPRPGVFFSPDVYEGVSGLERGSVKRLRVFQMDFKTYSTWRKTYRHSGPPVSIVQEEGVKRILGTAPVEEDGSVSFTVPAGRMLHFQLLDEHGRCLQTMRSFTGVLPGEQRGCIGCHESHSRAPPQRSGLAFRRPPSELTQPSWGTESIGYERFVQPVLGHHCGKCHEGDGDREAREALDLTLRPGHGVFKEPYLTLVGSAGWYNPVPNKGQPGYGIAGAIPVESSDLTTRDPKSYATLPPMRYLSYASKLIRMCMSGEHHGAKVSGEDLERLIAWVDACCPFLGDEEVRALGDPDFPCIEELPVRPRVATAPVIERP